MSENTILFPAEMHLREVRKVIHTLNELIEFRGFEHILLDFRNCRTVFPEAIVPLICVILIRQKEGVRFTLSLPLYERTKRLFLNCSWASFISPKQFSSSTHPVGDNIPLVRFSDQSEQDRITNSILDMLLRALSFVTRDDLRALEWSVNEICDNVLNHAQSDIGGVFQFSFRRFSREVEFIVADGGIGIPKSLRSLRNKDWSDEFALEQSIKQGVTRDPQFGQGNGLFGTYQIAGLSGGTFHINSGSAYLVVTRRGEVQVRRDPEPFLGTMVVCAINFTRPELLERALSFKGGSYRMVDWIETKYEQDENVIKMVIRDQAESLGSRRSGYEVRAKVKKFLKFHQDEKIIIVCDMSGVGVMSSSFADEVFGKLAMELGAEEYERKVSIINATRINIMLIERAIEQRLGQQGD